ncbi:DinB family protein [Fodinibius halophilus]|uniref:DinB family protein n=1 Tax=Fodinibius halophilus TaxID=1736908 RepID=A0A6M1SUB2_9BACT|nr:DinB family protein [Fodinibius halophilus]NGP87106.1 DinB family protein [Fodinibius halophilus]
MNESNALLIQFDLHHRLYNDVLDGFADQETNRRLHGNTDINHVKYLPGHLLDSQYGLAMLAGIKPKIKWEGLFEGMGQSEARDDIEYPSIGAIRQEWNRLHDPVREGLKQLTAEELKTSHIRPSMRLQSRL